MNKRHVFYVGLLLLAALVLIGAPMAAVAAQGEHPLVPLKQANGSLVGTSNMPYSPKMTCGGCHFNCTTNAYTGNTQAEMNTWCGATGQGAQKDCSVAGNCPDYESMATTSVAKTQGYLLANGTISNQTYSVYVPLHGASTGKHSTQGRNEGLTVAQRTVWGAPANISGTGMWGRF